MNERLCFLVDAWPLGQGALFFHMGSGSGNLGAANSGVILSLKKYLFSCCLSKRERTVEDRKKTGSERMGKHTEMRASGRAGKRTGGLGALFIQSPPPNPSPP